MGVFMCPCVSGHEQMCSYGYMVCVHMQVFLHVPVSETVRCPHTWNGCLCFHISLSCTFVLLYVLWGMLVAVFLRVPVCAVIPTQPCSCSVHRLSESGPFPGPGGEATRPFFPWMGYLGQKASKQHLERTGAWSWT